MILGTGIDIIEVSRITEKVSRDNGFVDKVFSAREIELCRSRREKDQHFAARFAAKEAFLKACGRGLTAGFDLRHVEVVNDDLGKPFIELHGGMKSMAEREQWSKIHVSLSHIREFACAVVIIES